MIITRLKTNRIYNPLGFELRTPKLSWVVEDAKGTSQKWARVTISSDINFADIIFDSGEDETADSIAYPINIELNPMTRYFWKVAVMDNEGDYAQSETAWFETGRMSVAFEGKQITPDLPFDVMPYMRKTFTVDEDIKTARAYFTGLGIYELYINGNRVGDEYLTPYCDEYDKWIQYQTYDVTDYLVKGQNTVGAILGNGWAKGKFGFDGETGSFETGYKGKPSDIFVDKYMLLGDITVNGKTVVCTDETWQCTPSPLKFSSIYDGEMYDSNAEIKDWASPEGDYNACWNKVKLYQDNNIGVVSDRLSLPVKKMESFKPKLITTPKNEFVLDTEQEITGWMEMKVNQPRGTVIRLQYGEILQDDCFYRDNLRSALAEYRFVCDGTEQLIRPISTFYGFRYVKVSGFVEEPKAEDFTAYAVYSNLETTGNIVTSNEKVNRLFKNSLWSQRDNFVDVPTDCPQRDERMGWTGDAQAFSGTANFNMDCLAFYTKYGKDMYLDQLDNDGRVPQVTPLMVKEGMLKNDGGSVGWADAATVVPWTTYVYSGDISILESQYPSMKAWADWVFKVDEGSGSTRLWKELAWHWGDWLALDGARSGFDPENCIGGTNNTFLCTAYYYYSTTLVAKAARALGKDDEAVIYENRAKEILQACRDEFFTKGGRCAANTQTGNAMSLFFGLAPEEHREKVRDELLNLLKQNKMHLKTGFLGTPVLCRALSDNGANDAAYTLFLNEDLPSWLYEVNMGATTIWERWNSINPDGKISGISMNSMNHYAYGAVIEWVYRNVCGLNPREDAPGFRKVDIKPQPDKRLPSAEATVNSPVGEYISGWHYEGDKVVYNIKVPFGAEAHVRIQADTLGDFTLNGEKISVNEKFYEAVLACGEYEIR
ncbi:MAG: family 78 glycoside hydrolase catalytic domain [Clostridia bacterium]|nr:family 78 glycoside hydrolase catalytic domain [Clostridia bacterium]